MLMRFLILMVVLLSQVGAMQPTEIVTQRIMRRFLGSPPKPHTLISARSCASFTKPHVYADATVDTAFKEMMWRGDNDPIASSFIRTFVPAIQIESIERLVNAPLAIPALKQRGKKQTFMDFHVKAKDGHHYLVEMQSQRHVRFDERSLFYACSVYSRQLSEECFDDSSWFRHLKPVIAIQVVDYDTNRTRGVNIKEKNKDGKEVSVADPDDKDFIRRVRGNPLASDQAEKHYMMTDKNSGQKLDHLQMIQIELPRYEVSRLPGKNEKSTDKDWWIRVLRYSDEYTESEVKNADTPPFVKEALDRLTFSKWDPVLVQEYKEDQVDRGKYSTVLQIERAEGKAEGELQAKQEVARALIAEGMTDSLIAKTTNLPFPEVKALRASSTIKPQH